MKVRLKGLNRVRKSHRDGSVSIYYYAWKGGPRLPGKPTDAEFVSAYIEAQKSRKSPQSDNLKGLTALYRSKPEFEKLAASTKKQWSRWLDNIVLDSPKATPPKTGLGDLSYRALEDAKVRADLLDWRDQWAATPRAADYGVQVLSRLLGFGVERGLLSVNRAAGIPHLYEANRADLIWEPQAIAKVCALAPASVSQALRLACLTGLRRSDLIKLRWRHVSDLAIEIETGKSGGRTLVTVPLLADARALLAEIGRKSPGDFVLLNSFGRQWRADGLTERVSKFASDANVERSLHDARGTFATRLRIAALTEEEIAEVMGWERDRVRRILARYVDQERIVKALVRKVEANERTAPSPNFFPTGPEADG